jgi:hypothetical protein
VIQDLAASELAQPLVMTDGVVGKDVMMFLRWVTQCRRLVRRCPRLQDQKRYCCGSHYGSAQPRQQPHAGGVSTLTHHSGVAGQQNDKNDQWWREDSVQNGGPE